MKRVVVTGMGIVSSIGDNIEEVLDSLLHAKSGITTSEDMVTYGFRSQVFGTPKVDPFEILDRRQTRFLAKGSAWNYLAMQQAIDDSGLEKDDVSNIRTGIVMGSGGPSTQTVYQAALLTEKNKSPKRIGPFAVPKTMSSTASATLATPFEIKGINLSLIHISEPTRPPLLSRMPSSA